MKTVTKPMDNHTAHATAMPVMSNVPQRSSKQRDCATHRLERGRRHETKSPHRRFELGQVQQLGGGSQEKNAAYQQLEEKNAIFKHWATLHLTVKALPRAPSLTLTQPVLRVIAFSIAQHFSLSRFKVQGNVNLSYFLGGNRDNARQTRGFRFPHSR